MTEQENGSEMPTMSASGSGGGLGQGQPVPEIEGYEIRGEIRRGGMGVIYRAYNTRLDRWVAIKTLILADASSWELEILQREARMVAKLRHPNIVGIYDFFPGAQPPCFAMELVEGVPFTEAVGGMSYKQKAKLLSKVARAVAYAHDRNVLHRDLKPDNIMMDRSGEPRILDFGLARRAVASEEASKSIKGTPRYMSPEQFVSPQTVGAAADIYALGLILFELIVEMKPPAPSDRSSAESWAERILPLPRELNPSIPEAMQRICLKACERDPQDRYPTARHLADDLDRFIADAPIAARPTLYSHLVEERVESHLDDLKIWEDEGLITGRERDTLAHRYISIARRDSLWLPGARAMRWGPTVSHLGGWLVIVSALLWPAFYWQELSRWQRVAAVGAPTLILNLVGVLMWRQQKRLLGTIFCGVGAVLVPIFLIVFFSEFDLFEWRQSDRFELLPPDMFCNLQFFLAFGLMLAYCTALTWRTRLGIFSLLATVSAALTYMACLLLFGLKEKLTESEFAAIACWFWPLVAGWFLAGSILDRRRLEHLATPPYIGAGVAFIAVSCVLAWDAPRSWPWLRTFGAKEQEIAMYLLFVANGLIFLLVAWLCDRSWSRIRRTWGRWFYRLVPPFCVVPIDRMEGPLRALEVKSLVLFTITCGGQPTEVYLTEILAILACLGFVALAVHLQWRWYMYYGLIHHATLLVLFTQAHLLDYLSWPMVLLIVGTLTMFLGVVIESRYARLGEKLKTATENRL